MDDAYDVRSPGPRRDLPSGGAHANPDNADLIIAVHPTDGRSPVELLLARRSPESRQAVRDTLDRIAALLTAGQGTARTLAWHRLRQSHVAAIRAALKERYAPPVANKMLTALRGVLKQCRALGLMAAEDYERACAPTGLEAGRPAPVRMFARGTLLSVLETCSDEELSTAQQNGAIRALLHADAFKAAPAAKPGGARHTPAPVLWGTTMMPEQLQLRRVTSREAIVHALWEADVCLRQWAFCACLTMLRRGLTLWSAEYRDAHGMAFDTAAGESDTLDWRLRKIAGENRLYRDLIHAVMESLGGVVQGENGDTYVCRAGHPLSYDRFTAARLKASYKRLHELVVTLVAATIPDLPL